MNWLSNSMWREASITLNLIFSHLLTFTIPKSNYKPIESALVHDRNYKYFDMIGESPKRRGLLPRFTLCVFHYEERWTLAKRRLVLNTVVFLYFYNSKSKSWPLLSQVLQLSFVISFALMSFDLYSTQSKVETKKTWLGFSKSQVVAIVHLVVSHFQRWCGVRLSCAGFGSHTVAETVGLLVTQLLVCIPFLNVFVAILLSGFFKLHAFVILIGV